MDAAEGMGLVRRGHETARHGPATDPAVVPPEPATELGDKPEPMAKPQPAAQLLTSHGILDIVAKMRAALGDRTAPPPEEEADAASTA